MCSNNQSSIPSGENTLHYDRDELARDILDVHIFNDEALGESLYSNLSYIKEQCETVKQICLDSPMDQRVDISTDDLHGFLTVIVRQIKVAKILAARLSSLEMRFNSETRKYQQTQQALSGSQKRVIELEKMLFPDAKNTAGES